METTLETAGAARCSPRNKLGPWWMALLNPLRHERELGLRRLPLQPPQGAQLDAIKRMDRRGAFLDPPHVQPRSGEVDLVPPQIDRLRSPQATAKGDHRGVAMPPPIPMGPERRPSRCAKSLILCWRPKSSLGSTVIAPFLRGDSGELAPLAGGEPRLARDAPGVAEIGERLFGRNYSRLCGVVTRV